VVAAIFLTSRKIRRQQGESKADAKDPSVHFIGLFSIGAVFIICDSQKVSSESRNLGHLHRDHRSSWLVDEKQRSDCMQRDRAIKIAAIVTNALRTRSRRDGSHGVRAGSSRAMRKCGS
jgi:hypothetical protein